jgi:hypothetical protein
MRARVSQRRVFGGCSSIESVEMLRRAVLLRVAGVGDERSVSLRWFHEHGGGGEIAKTTRERDASTIVS